MDGYLSCLKAAGADVTDTIMIGEWSGIWAARLADDTFILDYYGSCSGCDAYEGAFSNPAYDETPRGPKYQAAQRKFGENLLRGLMPRKAFLVLVAERLNSTVAYAQREGEKLLAFAGNPYNA